MCCMSQHLNQRVNKYIDKPLFLLGGRGYSVSGQGWRHHHTVCVCIQSLPRIPHVYDDWKYFGFTFATQNQSLRLNFHRACTQKPKFQVELQRAPMQQQSFRMHFTWSQRQTRVSSWIPCGSHAKPSHHQVLCAQARGEFWKNLFMHVSIHVSIRQKKRRRRNAARKACI